MQNPVVNEDGAAVRDQILSGYVALSEILPLDVKDLIIKVRRAVLHSPDMP
jgi:hypothetical protein